jgi:hypothetical protein
MANLDDYLFSMEALPDQMILAQGLAALAPQAAGTGTCGVVTAGDGLALPALAGAAFGSWKPAAACALPLPLVMGRQAAWLPGWAELRLPRALAAAEGSFPALADAALVPLFTLAGAGAGAALTLPLAVTALSDCNRRAAASLFLPRILGQGRVCSQSSPASGAATRSEQIVALLGAGDADLAEAVSDIPAGDDDAVAALLLARVAGSLVYEAEADDAWRCAPATLALLRGDCEDGALLLHGLMLAAGLPAERIVTVFGRVGARREGHAWVAWRRLGDGRWTVLDWTLGAGQGAVAALPVLGDPNAYAWVDYALTSAAFFTVRQDAATFFARANAEMLALPPPVCRANASHGALGRASLPGGLEAAAQTGSLADLALAAPRLAATAGWVQGQGALCRPGVFALAGGAGGARLPLALAAALGGGSGRAGAGLGCPVCLARAGQTALVAGTCQAARPGLAGWGLAGTLAGGLCPLALLQPAGAGRAGGLAWGTLGVPLLALAGLGRPDSRGRASLAPVGLDAAGQGHGPAAGFGRRGNGEEWA